MGFIYEIIFFIFAKPIPFSLKRIFPKEILENTIEVFKFKHTVKSKIIYSLLLIAIVSSLAALPFIKVDVYTSSTGIIKPNKERIGIALINAGKVQFSAIENNKEVFEGDTLLIIESKIIDEQLNYSTNQAQELGLFIEDLNYLTSNPNIDFKNIRSAKYQSDFLEYEQNLRKLQTRFSQAEINFKRNQSLFEKGVIAAVEFETVKSEYDLAKNEINSFIKQQLNSWQSELTSYNDALEELSSNKTQLLENKSQFFVTAPASGTLLNIIQVEVGSYIPQGARVAEISPNTDLIAECYISPSDIGMINPDKKVVFQIDAYNYNQWGLANGEIIEISKDVEILENTPVFKVRCRIEQEHLQLKNGIKGQIKKGMTLNARFHLAERSLYQLLYDNMDDWLNPGSA